MNATIESKPGPVKNRTTVERKSDREVVVKRTINGPARIVFEAFTKAELLTRWWVPKSMGMTLLSCEVDAHVGGTYRLVFDAAPTGSADAMLETFDQLDGLLVELGERSGQ